MVSFSNKNLALNQVLLYFSDTTRAQRFYYSNASPDFAERFVGYTKEDLMNELESSLAETEMLSVFSVLAAIEAAFRVDFLYRCKTKKRDRVSKHFRNTYRANGEKIRLEEDILDVWRDYDARSKALISDIKGLFQYRHWLAHGRYYIPRLARQKHDFHDIFALTSKALETFPLYDADGSGLIR
jgi:hypothetical protein